MAGQAAKGRFEMFRIDGLQETPQWWPVRVDQISTAMERAVKGQARTIAKTAGGYPVWAAAYGQKQALAGQASWAIGSNSGRPEVYKTGEESGGQVVVLVGGVHAAETEAIAGIMNLVSLMETGVDLRGVARPDLVELVGRYRLVLLPCVNMDGRAISPDHLRGATMEEFRRASQGVWSDGTEVGYPSCKQWWPLPMDRVEHPGGYHTSEGYNIMHDASAGDIRTSEARALLKLVAEEQADLVLHLHSHSIGGQMLGAPLMAYPFHVARTHQYKERVHGALEKAGLRPAPVHAFEQRCGIGLGVACTTASGALSPTFEQSAIAEWTFEEALETFYVTVETFLEHGVAEPFSPRRQIARGQLPEGQWPPMV